jgi:medium-chain acyl-[acyl-carrier-protein] hydrolase
MMSISGEYIPGRDNPVNLFMLPFAGGNVYSYRAIEKELGPGIKAAAIDLPGHGRRLDMPLLTDIRRMADDLFLQIRNRLDAPYALFGHSMGATLGYLLTRRILAEELSCPMHLFCTGRQAPTVESREKGSHNLPGDPFLEKVRAYDGLPDALLKEKDVLAFFEPILRADFEAIGSYRYTPAPPLDLPITVIIGTEERTSYEDACRWREVTTGEVTVLRFHGKHFFIFRHARTLAGVIEERLIPVGGPAVGSDRNRRRRATGHA